jgi:hypothetical protein
LHIFLAKLPCQLNNAVGRRIHSGGDGPHFSLPL